MTGDDYANAVRLHQQGDMEAAERGYRDVLKENDGHVGAWHLLGVLLHQRGDHDAAIAHIQTSVNLGNRQAACFNNLGAIYLTLAELEPAEREFQRAISINPNFADAHTNLGHVAFRLGELAAAGKSFRKALEINPAHTPALAALGRLLLEEGQPLAALAHLRQAVQIQPGDAHAWKTLGHIYIAISEPEKAVDAFRRAHSILPSDTDTQFSLGTALDQIGEYEEGERRRMAAIKSSPKQDWWKLKHALLCPDIVLDACEITAYEARLHTVLDEFAAAAPAGAIDDLAAHDTVLPYAIQGYGLNERLLRSKFAALISRYAPSFDPIVNRSGPFRIGVVVTAGHEVIFRRQALPWINRIASNDLRFVISCPANSWNEIRKWEIAPSVQSVVFPARPTLAAEILRKQRFDVLYYREAGTDSLNYLLATMRLAPIQCTSTGMQATTGLSTIDDYVSSKWIEIPEADDHYTERLVRLQSLTTLQHRQETAAVNRNAFGLSTDVHVYLCVQNPLKVHPAMDRLIANILRRDQKGVIVFPNRSQSHNCARLRHRICTTAPDIADRIIFVPHVAGPQYRDLLASADVHLDTFPYGASITTFDIFSQCGPLVTKPTEFQRSRYALGCYRRMNFLDLVATTPDDYVNIAERLGTDRDWREHVRRELAERTPCLFDESLVIQSFEDYFIEAAARARRG